MQQLLRIKTLVMRPGLVFGTSCSVSHILPIALVVSRRNLASLYLKPPECLRVSTSGAIMVGKTNMDQFAAGLVGTRTPFGVARCAFDDRFVPGGSSSGSGVVVGAGLVSFALGTDTAGSGVYAVC